MGNSVKMSLTALVAGFFSFTLAGSAWERHSPVQDPGEKCSPVYVVNAGEIKLCQDICVFRKAEGLKEIYRGERASLECVCETAKFNISGKILGKGPVQ